MAFPQTPLPLSVEISLDGSTWTDITSDVRSEEQIRISRGKSDWGQQVEAGRCSFSLSNTDGKYSPRNPEGTYYGQIGRNTPVRVSVETGSVALDLPGDSGDYASTPDAAALDITGDIDIRLDATLLNWFLPEYPSSGETNIARTELISKRALGQASWALYVNMGVLYFVWSEDGTLFNIAESTEDLPVTSSGRLAVRVTLDVDNGASGNDVAFYTSDSISGSWTQLGETVTGVGTTSIFAGTAELRIGSEAVLEHQEAIGLIHAAQVLDGIGGTAVANPDFTAQTVGDTSFADAAGLTWTVNGNAEITNRKVRFIGEISSWTPRWDTGGFDVVTEVEAAGVMRRLETGTVPLKSPVYREYTSQGRVDAGIVAYWPMEDGDKATELASAFDGHPAMKITGTVTPAAYSDYVASDSLPTIDTGSLKVSVPPYDLDASSRGRLAFFVKVPAAGVVSTQRLVSLTQTGTAAVWSVYVNTSGNLDVRAYDDEGTQIHASGFGSDSINGLEKFVLLALTQDGSDVDYTLLVTDIADGLATEIPDLTSTSFSITGTETSATTGRFTQIRFGEDGAMNETALGHVSVGAESTSHTGTAGAVMGWNAEESPSRIARLGIEESVHAYATGAGDERMGVQARDTVIDLMRAAEQVDKGILCEQRSILGVRYVTRASLYNQPVAFSINYTGSDGLVAPLDPVDDDQSVTNDVTEVRDVGASGRAVLTEGALSTQAPPNGIGLYDTSYTTNLLDDTQPPLHAGWRLHIGTWDETRFPQVTIDLANAPGSIEEAAAVDTGSRIQITNPPVWLPPDTLDLLVQGYSEVLDQYTWKITYNCVPNGPFNVATEGDSLYNRADTEGAELAEAMTSAATTGYVLTTSGPLWTTDSAEHPFSIRVAGEVMSATDVESWATDAFGRSVSNGWGTADSGQSWSTGGGTAGNYNVTGGYGSHTLATTNASRRTFLTFDFADFEAYVSLTVSAVATGGFLSGGITGRYTDSDNLYTARVAFGTSNELTLTIRERVAAVETQLGSYSLLDTYSAGTSVRLRFQVSGSTLRAKAWLAANTEPGPWQIEVTDTSLTTSDFIGLRSISSSANTNVNPEIRYDDFEVTNPQEFTVTRSVNGVTKAQSSGADVRLAYPAYTAL